MSARASTEGGVDARGAEGGRHDHRGEPLAEAHHEVESAGRELAQRLDAGEHLEEFAEEGLDALGRLGEPGAPEAKAASMARWRSPMPSKRLTQEPSRAAAALAVPMRGVRDAREGGDDHYRLSASADDFDQRANGPRGFPPRSRRTWQSS